MCGIIGYTGQSYLASKIVLDGLEKLEYRGYDSAGLAVLQGDVIKVRRDSGKLRNIRPYLEEGVEKNTLAIGHTRWATHGKPTQENAHPHSSEDGKIVVVHNGIIENYLPLKKSLQRDGFEFKSETDTEIIVHLISHHLEALGSEATMFRAFENALKDLKGAYALAVISVNEPDTIYVARKNCPLLVGLTEDGGNFVASDVAPMLSYTRDVVFLEDEQYGIVRSSSFELFSLQTNEKIEHKVEKVEWNPVMAEKAGYKHFMMKEIHEQPDVIRNTLGSRINEEDGAVYLEEVNLDSSQLSKIRRIVITACGTAFYAGMVGKYLIERAARIPVECDLASEFRYRDPICDENTLVIAVSQSGETADTIAAIDLAKSKGAKTLGIINVKGSSLSRKVDGTLYIHAGPEIGVASTKAYMAMVVAFELLSLDFAQKLQTKTVEQVRKSITGLKHIAGQVEELLKQKEKIEKLAHAYMNYRNFLYLGRDLNFPTALEGALKLKEISYIHAEGYASGEMKHGPIALLDPDCPVVAILTKGSVYEKVVSNIQEARSRDCRVLAIGTEGDDHLLDHVDDLFLIQDVQEELIPMLAVVPLQLLAYYIADLKGADVDQPRNLAKSVTVE